MALTQISTDGIKDGTITGADLATNVDLVDNKKIRFGTGNDLQIYHDATDSYIENTGKLYIKSSNFVDIRSSGNETMIKAIPNGAVELYYNNSNKFETNAEGVRVNGFLEMLDNQRIQMGTGDDLQIYHDGTHSYINEAGNGNLVLRTAQGTYSTIVLQAGQENSVVCHKNGNVELYYDNSKKFETRSGGLGVFGHIEAGDNNKLMLGDSNDLQIYHDGSASHIQDNVSNALRISADSIALQSGDKSEAGLVYSKNGAILLYYDNSKKFETTSSGITVQGTVVETSDIALKSDIQPITNSLEKIQQIVGCKYTLNSSVSKSMGVIAQDVEKVFPELVHGSEGNKTLQYSGLIGVLIEAVKELSAEVAALKAG